MTKPHQGHFSCMIWAEALLQFLTYQTNPNTGCFFHMNKNKYYLPEDQGLWLTKIIPIALVFFAKRHYVDYIK